MGSQDVARLTPADIYAAMDKNAHRVRFANYLPTAFSMLSKLAVRWRWRTDSPALGIEKLAVPKDVVGRMCLGPTQSWRRCGPSPLASRASSSSWACVACSDLVHLTWCDFDGDKLTLCQNKTDKPLVLPCTDALKAALARAKAEFGAAPHPSRTVLTKQDDRPCSTARWPEPCARSGCGSGSSPTTSTRYATAA